MRYWVVVIGLLLSFGMVNAVETATYRIAYWSAVDKEIWTVKPDGTDTRQITHDGVDKHGLVASPDGKYLAYYVQSWYDPEKTNNLTLQVVVVLDVATGEQRMITGQEAIDHLSWSVDSARLLFAVLSRHELDMSYEIEVVNRDGSGRTQLREVEGWSTGVSWPPDWQYILFAGWDNSGHYYVSIMNTDGSNSREIVQLDSCFICLVPQWTPDGQAIVFFRHPDLFIVDVEGKNLRQLTDFAQVYNVIDVSYARYDGPQYAMSADDQHLIYTMGYPIELVRLNLGQDSWKQHQVLCPSVMFRGVLAPDDQSAFIQSSDESGGAIKRIMFDTCALHPVVKDGVEPVILAGAS